MKARALGVSEERLTNLTSRFGVECFPQVALNVPDVTLSTKKTKILQEIYSMPVERGDTQDISRSQKRAKPLFSRLKSMELSGSFQPTKDCTRPASPTRDNSPGSSQREESSSPRLRSLRQQPIVDYKSQLNPPDVISHVQ
ncbi:hypothetical protein R1flu_027213 [Riccia fluitans]|uniref:Uncharacterized protein n=1 Tax=Riccia fluitans TaxID=41844 RepID=A0ABD1XI99_9MARC